MLPTTSQRYNPPQLGMKYGPKFQDVYLAGLVRRSKHKNVYFPILALAVSSPRKSSRESVVPLAQTFTVGISRDEMENLQHPDRAASCSNSVSYEHASVTPGSLTTEAPCDSLSSHPWFQSPRIDVSGIIFSLLIRCCQLSSRGRRCYQILSQLSQSIT